MNFSELESGLNKMGINWNSKKILLVISIYFFKIMRLTTNPLGYFILTCFVYGLVPFLILLFKPEFSQTFFNIFLIGQAFSLILFRPNFKNEKLELDYIIGYIKIILSNK